MRRLASSGALLTVVLANAGPAAACAVCYGAADDPVLEAVNLSVLFMLGLVYLVLGGGVTMALFHRRHRSRLASGSEGSP